MDARNGTELKRGAIGVSHIVFFVVAAAAPLTVVVGVSPAAFAFGNGAGTPATYLLVGLLYLVFSVGFTAMSRFVGAGSAGGFYPYISSGLGRPSGVSAAFIAIATYTAIDISVFGLFGFFMNDMVKTAGGPEIHWLIYDLALAAVVFLCGMRNVEFSGKLLGVCMVGEMAIIVLFGVAVLIGGGPEGFAPSAFGASAVFTPGLGISLVFVVTSFVGFEATAIFGEEAREPKRTIARATYLAVVLIAVFYAFATWAIAVHYGPSKIAAEAGANTATLYLSAVESRLGSAAALIMKLLLVTSMFACALSFHNTINRYFYALGREGVAWAGLARTHLRHQSPYVAGVAQTVMTVGVCALFASLGQDPYAVVFAWMGTFASLGILALQVLVSLAVIAFFARDARGVGLWTRLVAPVLGIAGLVACLGFMIANLALVSGSESIIVESFPVMIVAIGVIGLLFAGWIRSTRPAVYDSLGRAFG